jgi:hypothetical protein
MRLPLARVTAVVPILPEWYQFTHG